MSNQKEQRVANRGRRGLLKAGGSGLALSALGAPGLAGAQAPVVKIGSIGPMTGALAYNGTQARAGIQYAVDDINTKGGIKSMGGAKLEVIFTDAESRPDVAAAQVDKLAEAGVSCLVGCQASSLTLATTQAAARYGLPQVIDVGSAEQIVERGLPNVFRFSPGVVRSVEQGIGNLDSHQQGLGQEGEDGRDRARGGPVRLGHGEDPEGEAPRHRSGGRRDDQPPDAAARLHQHRVAA